MTATSFEAVAAARSLPLHRLLRRGLVSGQRSVDRWLQAHAAGTPVFILLQRRPASPALHLGQACPFVLASYLQKLLGCYVVIEIRDATTFLAVETTLETVAKNAKESAKDVLALGFDESRTFVFNDSQYVDALYRSVLKIQKKISYQAAQKVLNLTGSENTGLPGNSALQAAAALSSSYPHLFGQRTDVPCLMIGTEEQEPLFAFAEEAARQLQHAEPSMLFVRALPTILGNGSRMSAKQGLDIHMLLTSDTANQIKKKINSYALSGGRDTKEEHRQFGGNIAVDIPYQLLTYFLEDDAELDTIAKTYTTGELLTGEIKQKCISVLQEFVAELQQKRKEISDDRLAAFMSRTDRTSAVS